MTVLSEGKHYNAQQIKAKHFSALDKRYSHFISSSETYSCRNAIMDTVNFYISTREFLFSFLKLIPVW